MISLHMGWINESTHTHTFWVQVPHVSGFQGVVGADLDLELQDGVWKTLKEKLIDCHVKSWDDFLQREQITHLLASICNGTKLLKTDVYNIV